MNIEKTDMVVFLLGFARYLLHFIFGFSEERVGEEENFFLYTYIIVIHTGGGMVVIVSDVKEEGDCFMERVSC